MLLWNECVWEFWNNALWDNRAGEVMGKENNSKLSKLYLLFIGSQGLGQIYVAN